MDRIIDRRWDPPVNVGVRLMSVVNDCTQHVGQTVVPRGVMEGSKRWLPYLSDVLQHELRDFGGAFDRWAVADFVEDYFAYAAAVSPWRRSKTARVWSHHRL